MFQWKEREFKTYPELIDFALKLEKEEQEAFVERYAKETGAYALQNIGYFAGYYDRETKHKIFEVFKTSHPIFGRRDVSPEEAYNRGREVAALTKERKRIWVSPDLHSVSEKYPNVPEVEFIKRHTRLTSEYQKPGYLEFEEVKKE